MISLSRVVRASALGTSCAVLIALASSGPAAAATSYTRVELGATRDGTSVTATTVVKASRATTVDRYGICARSSAGTHVDFPMRGSSRITTTGLRFTSTRTFAAGTYSYFPCLYIGGRWINVGAAKSFTVGTTALPPTEPPPTEPLPSSTGPAMGAQFHGMWGDYTDAQRAQVLDQMVAMGATDVRIDVGWAMLQPTGPTTYDPWGVAFVDRVINMATTRGLKVLVTFHMTPGWANNNRGAWYEPNNPADYARAFAYAVDKWPQVAAWEVWNEPNATAFWAPNADPVSYTRLLCAANAAVPAATTVVFSGTMHNDAPWIRRAYQADAKGCFDIMATHPYPGMADESPLAADTSIWNFRHITAIRQVQADYADLKPIWVTEFGWSSHANTGNEANWNRGVTETQQARYAVDAMKLLRSDYPYVRRAYWYNERNKSTGNVHQDNFGLLNRDLTRKPIWTALRDYLATR